MTRFAEHLIFVDESGSPSLGNVDPDYPLLVLVFWVVKKSDYIQHVVPALQRFKFKHFGHDQVVLHEREIRRDLGAFSFLKSRELKQAFLDELTQLIADAPFHAVAVVIRKDALKARYAKPGDPYHLALEFGLERVKAFLIERGDWRGKGLEDPAAHVIVEQRGKEEDGDLELQFRRICAGGNYHSETWPFQLIFASKQSNSSGLQLADLMARPVGMSVLKPTQANRAFEVIKPKLFTRQGRYSGWGLKCFP